MAKLDDVIKNINKKFKTNIVTQDNNDVTFNVKDRIPFPTPSLTYLFHGGFPVHTLWELSGDMSAGKAQPLYSRVLTKDGWKIFKDIRIGDYIYGEDGKLHEVIGVFPQGFKPIYEITFTDGATCRCSDEHLWTYITPKLREKYGKDAYNHAFVSELKTIIQNFKDNPSLQGKYIFPTNECVNFSEKELKIPPYILGLLLGDGGFTSHNITFTNAEEDILHDVKQYALENDMICRERKQLGCYQLVFRKADGVGKYRDSTKIVSNLKFYNLLGTHSYNKFIPDVYLFSNEQQRLELLAGLINTDGYVTEIIKLESASKTLVDNVIYLCRSLGIRANVGYTRDADGKSHRPTYTTTISLDDRLLPLLSDKHKKKYNKQSTKLRRARYIKTIKYIGKEECQCIYIDNPTHLYITDDFVVTHNTVLSMALAGKAQKYFKEKYEKEVEELSNSKQTKEQQEKLAQLLERGYKKVAWLDSEHSLNDIEWAAKNGLDISDIIYIKPQEESAEELLDITLALIESDSIGLLVIDSIAALTSNAALHKDLTEKTYCGIAGPLTTWTSKVLPMLNKYDCSVICINQCRDTLNAQFPTTHTVGGRAFGYGTHVRIELRKEKAIDEDYNEIPNKEETYYGQLTAVQIKKNKITKPDRRLCKFTISFDEGISAINDTFIMATALGIIDKAGAWYSILGEDGEPKEYNGTLLKFQGKKNFILFMKENPSFAEELKNQVEKAVKQD